MSALSTPVYFTPAERRRVWLARARTLGYVLIALTTVALLERPMYFVARWTLGGVAPAATAPTAEAASPERALADARFAGNIAAGEDPLLGNDLYQIFRQLGNLWTWLFIAMLLYAHDTRAAQRQMRSPWQPARPWQGPAGTHRAGLLLLSAVTAGALAELLKPLLKLSRPTRPTFLDPVVDAANATVTVDTSRLLDWSTAGHRIWGWFADEEGRAAADQLGWGMASSHAAVAFGALVMIGRLFPATMPWCVTLAAWCAVSRLASGAHFTTDVAVGGLIGWLVATWLHSVAEPRQPEDSPIVAGGRLL